MKFLITGGAGTMVRDLTAALVAKGHKVRVRDKRPWGLLRRGIRAGQPGGCGAIAKTR